MPRAWVRAWIDKSQQRKKNRKRSLWCHKQRQLLNTAVKRTPTALNSFIKRMSNGLVDREHAWDSTIRYTIYQRGSYSRMCDMNSMFGYKTKQITVRCMLSAINAFVAISLVTQRWLCCSLVCVKLAHKFELAQNTNASQLHTNSNYSHAKRHCDDRRKKVREKTWKCKCLRKIDTTTFVLRSIPHQIRSFFVFRIGVSNWCTFWYCFRILAVLPRTNPFIRLGVAGLQEEATEMLVSANRHWNTKEKKTFKHYARRVEVETVPWICWPGW